MSTLGGETTSGRSFVNTFNSQSSGRTKNMSDLKNRIKEQEQARQYETERADKLAGDLNRCATSLADESKEVARLFEAWQEQIVANGRITRAAQEIVEAAMKASDSSPPNIAARMRDGTWDGAFSLDADLVFRLRTALDVKTPDEVQSPTGWEVAGLVRRGDGDILVRADDVEKDVTPK